MATGDQISELKGQCGVEPKGLQCVKGDALPGGSSLRGAQGAAGGALPGSASAPLHQMGTEPRAAALGTEGEAAQGRRG